MKDVKNLVQQGERGVIRICLWQSSNESGDRLIIYSPADHGF